MTPRLLTKDDIDVRVGSKSKDGKKAQLLLYKDARVDMALLDEIYGSQNWQTKYEVIDGVLFCSIGVYCGGQWVWKQSNGVESKGQEDGNNTKGEASDAMKRSGFLWGIGRELYNCKGIWVDITDGEFLAFVVTEIEFDERTLVPTRIVISDTKGNVRYTKGKSTQNTQKADLTNVKTEPAKETVEQTKVAVSPKIDVVEPIVHNDETSECWKRVMGKMKEFAITRGATQGFIEASSFFKERNVKTVSNLVNVVIKELFGKLKLDGSRTEITTFTNVPKPLGGYSSIINETELVKDLMTSFDRYLEYNGLTDQGGNK